MNPSAFKIFAVFFVLISALFGWGLITVLGQPNTGSNVILTLISYFVTLLLIYQLASKRIIPIWIPIFLLIFVFGHYFRTYLAFSTLNSGESLATLNPEWHSIGWNTVTYGLVVATTSILLLLLVTLVFVRTSNNCHPFHLKSITIRNRGYLLPMLLLSTLTSISLFALRQNLGIGRMGFETVRLPFQLDTVIFRFQSEFLPILFLFLAFVYHQVNKIILRNLTIVLLLAHYVLVSISALSKSGLAFGIISVAILFYLMRALTKPMKYLLGVGVIFAFLFFQFGWTIRGAALSGDLGNYSALDLIMETIKDFTAAPFEIVKEVALRITGADGIWQTHFLVSLLPEPSMLYNIMDRGVVDVFTRDIVGVVWIFDFREPGIIATFMLIGGFVGFPFFFLFFLFGVAMLWKHLEHSKAAPVIGTYTAISLLMLATSGAFSINELISYIAGLIFYLALCSLFISERTPARISNLNGEA